MTKITDGNGITEQIRKNTIYLFLSLFVSLSGLLAVKLEKQKDLFAEQTMRLVQECSKTQLQTMKDTQHLYIRVEQLETELNAAQAQLKKLQRKK